MSSSNSSNEDSDAGPKRKRKIRALEDSPASTSSGSPIISMSSSLRNKMTRRVPTSSSESDTSGSPIITSFKKRIKRVTSDSESESSDDIVVRMKRTRKLESESDMETDDNSSQWESDAESETPFLQTAAVLAEKNGTDSDASDGTAEKCPICLLSFKKQEIGIPESCDHTFCLECIQEWSKNMNTCPVDRQEYRLILVRENLNGKVIRRIPIERPTPQDVDILEDQTCCEICGSNEFEDRLLLCDGCDLGFHLFCLTPALSEVPAGSWYCNECSSNSDGYNSETMYVRLVIEPQQEARRQGPRSRLVPRTRQSERVRRRIESNRHQNSLGNSSPNSTAIISASTASSAPRSNHVSSSTPSAPRRKKKRRSRAKYRTVYEIDEATGETVAIKKRVRKKAKRVRRRNNRPVLRPKTVKKRLAQQLGICPPRTANQNLPDVKIPNIPSTPSSNISGMRHSAGIPALRLFGDTNELDYFSEEEDYSLGSQVLIRRAPNQNDVSAMRRAIRRKNIAVPEVVSSTSDLLGSILNSQEQFYSRNASYSLDSSGKFQVDSKDSRSKEYLDINKQNGAVKESPYYPNKNQNNRYNQNNYNYNQNRYQNRRHSNNYNYQYNNNSNRNFYTNEPSSSMNYRNNFGGGEDNDYPQDYSQRTLCATAESNVPEEDKEEKEDGNRNPNSESEVDIYSDIETVTTSKADEEEGDIRPPSPPVISHPLNTDNNDDEDNNDSEGEMVIDDEKVADQEAQNEYNKEETAVTSTVGVPHHFEPPPPEFSSNNSMEIQSEAVQSSSLDEIKNYQYYNDDSSDGCPNANIYSREAKIPNDEDAESDDGCPNFSIYSKESKNLALKMNSQIGEVSSSPNIEASNQFNDNRDSYDPEEIYESAEEPSYNPESKEKPAEESEQSYDPENIYNEQNDSPEELEPNDTSYDPAHCTLPDESVADIENTFETDQSYDPEKIYDDEEEEEEGSDYLEQSIDYEKEVFKYNTPQEIDNVVDPEEVSTIEGDRYDPAVPFNDDLDEINCEKNEDKEKGEASDDDDDNKDKGKDQEKPPVKPVIKGGILGGLYSDSEDEDLIKKDENGYVLSDINRLTEDISEEERSYTPCLDEKSQKQGLEGLDTELISDEDRNDFDESHELKTQSDGDALEINAKESEMDFTRPEDYEEGEIIDKNKEKEVQSEPEPETEVVAAAAAPAKTKPEKTPDEKKSKKKKDKEKISNEDKLSGNKENEGLKDSSFKKLSKSNKERNYRGDRDKRHSSPRRYSRSRERDSSKKDRRKEKRKEIERYNVRAIIAEKPRPLVAKDQFGRDIRTTPSRSRSRSRSYTPPVRSMRSASRTGQSPIQEVQRSVSRTRKSRSRSRRSPSKEKVSKRRKSTTFRSATRSRSPIKKGSGSGSKNKKRRSLSNRFRKKKAGGRERSKTKKTTSRTRRRSRSGTPVAREWGERREWTPVSPRASPSWTPPRAVDNAHLLRNEHLTVTVNNSTKKKRDRKRKERRNRDSLEGGRQKRRRRERERTPPPSKEVFASGDNILVSVSFNNDNETRDVSTRDKRKNDEIQKKRKEKRKKTRKDLTGVKPVAIIDLDRSPFRELTPSPKQVIVLTDSENEGNGRDVQDNVCDSSQQVASPERGIGPKTPPEPQVKFSLAAKQPQVRAINNPLCDPEELETNSHVDDGTISPGMHIGPNTPPNSPPNSPDAYDPFEPTKSRSPTPDRQQPSAQDSQKSIDSRAAIDMLEKSINPILETTKSLTPPLADIQPADSQSSIQVTPDSNLEKSPERTSQTVQQQSKPVAQTIPFSSVPTSIITSTPINSNVATSRINILNSTVITPPVSSIPQRIVLPNQIIKSSPVKISPTKMPVKSTPIKPITKFNRVTRKRPQIEEIILDFDSPYSPGSSDYEDLFEPPSEIVTKPVIKNKNKSQQKQQSSAFDVLFGSPSYKKTKKYNVKKTTSGKTKTVGVKLDEDNLKILDELPNSAVEMQVKDKFLKKLNRQERVVEEVKLVLKPHYNKKKINKEEYKDIMRRSVPKICHNKSGEINPTKIKNLIEAYVRKIRHSKKVTSSSSVNLQKL